jgi:hypothetical protein
VISEKSSTEFCLVALDIGFSNFVPMVRS